MTFAKLKAEARKKAKALGHDLGYFVTQIEEYPDGESGDAWCRKCEAQVNVCTTEDTIMGRPVEAECPVKGKS